MIGEVYYYSVSQKKCPTNFQEAAEKPLINEND